MNKMTLTTTRRLLVSNRACVDGYKTLIDSLGNDWPREQPINLLHILESNGVQDMMWCLRATEQDCTRERYLISADMAESVLHIFTDQHPDDDRPALAIHAARSTADGKMESVDAGFIAVDAAIAGFDASTAVKQAAYAADYPAYPAAYTAAYAAAYAAKASKPIYAAYAAKFAVDSVDYAVDSAASNTEREKQAIIIRKYLA